jgi:hypothetical protein
MECPVHFSLLVFMYSTKSGSSYNLQNSKLYLLLHCPLSCTAPKILLRIGLSSSPAYSLICICKCPVSQEHMLLLALQLPYTISSLFSLKSVVT